MRLLLFVLTILAAACARQVSTTTLRLDAESEGSHAWVEVVDPPQMRAANVWIASCRAGAATTRVQPIYQSPRILSLSCRGSANQHLASFRISDGHRLSLDDTIQKGKMGQFQQAAVKAAKKRNLPVEFAAPADFALTAAGFVFALDGAEVLIPATEMRALLIADTALLVGR